VIDLILATRNAHKVQEIRDILGKNFRVQSLADYPKAPALVEDADTFAGNATRKATQLAHWLAKSDVFVVADDSGLEVDALNGAPGVHSARFAAAEKTTGNASDSANLQKLLRVMRDVPAEKRGARFRCVLALARGEIVQTFDGACEGRIAFNPSGSGGFGYDPLFIPNGHSQSFADLGEDIKNQISHRARALDKLKGYFNSLSQGHPGPTRPKA
jgi:XTP/dITP diphosphohydrolase